MNLRFVFLHKQFHYMHTCCSKALYSVEHIVANGVWPSRPIEWVGDQGQVDVTGEQLEVLQWGCGQLPTDDLEVCCVKGGARGGC